MFVFWNTLKAKKHFDRKYFKCHSVCTNNLWDLKACQNADKALNHLKVEITKLILCTCHIENGPTISSLLLSPTLHDLVIKSTAAIFTSSMDPFVVCCWSHSALYLSLFSYEISSFVPYLILLSSKNLNIMDQNPINIARLYLHDNLVWPTWPGHLTLWGQGHHS